MAMKREERNAYHVFDAVQWQREGDDERAVFHRRRNKLVVAGENVVEHSVRSCKAFECANGYFKASCESASGHRLYVEHREECE